MSCADVRLDEYLDGELDEAAGRTVEGHLGACASCREELERSRKLDTLLKKVPAGAVPDTDRFVQTVRARSRRQVRWGLAAAAAILIGVVGLLLSLPPSRPMSDPDVVATVQEYSKSPTASIEERLRKAGPGALRSVESQLESPDVKTQFAAATLLFKLADAPTRDRVLARYEQKKETNGGWMLMEPGVEEDDVEMVPVAVSLALDGQEEWALNVLRKLNRLNARAQQKVVDSVVTLLHSDNVKIQKLALDIVKELDIEFPLSAIVDLLDSAELGDEALRFLRNETRKDLGKDKDAWRKAIGQN